MQARGASGGRRWARAARRAAVAREAREHGKVVGRWCSAGLMRRRPTAKRRALRPSDDDEEVPLQRKLRHITSKDIQTKLIFYSRIACSRARLPCESRLSVTRGSLFRPRVATCPLLLPRPASRERDRESRFSRLYVCSRSKSPAK